MTVVVMEVVILGRAVGGAAFWEHAALMMLGLKVCRITGVVMVLKPVALLIADVAFTMAVAFKPAVELLLTAVPKLLVPTV